MSDTHLSTRDAEMYALEREMLKYPQADVPVISSFCRGLYARTIVIPANTLLVGAVHKEESFFIVRQGILKVTNGELGTVELGPGFMGITKAGEKRAGFAVTEVVFTTFHANPEEIRDEDKIWEAFTVPPPAETIEQTKATRCLS